MHSFMLEGSLKRQEFRIVEQKSPQEDDRYPGTCTRSVRDLCSSRIAIMALTHTRAFAPILAGMTMSQKVCVIGLDCAAPELVFDLWADRLPNLRRLWSAASTARWRAPRRLSRFRPGCA